MEKLSAIANDQFQDNLKELAHSLAIKEGEFVADIIAPGISKIDFTLGAFEHASEPAKPVSDILGQDMEANYIDTYNKLSLEKFQMEDHEIRGRLSNNLRNAYRADGMTDEQIDARIVNQLVRNLRANYELQVLEAIGNTSGYGPNLAVNCNSAKWDTANSDPVSIIDGITTKMAKLGAPMATVYIVADPATWAVLRRHEKVKGANVNGVRQFYTEDDIAQILAGPSAHGIVARQSFNGQFAFAGKLAIFCRPEVVDGNSECSWRTVYSGMNASAEPYVYRFSDPGTEHRGYTIGCTLDRKLCGTGTNTDNKQIWGGLCYNVI